jgi:drug/metabolite transporter (DMT)-like permease
VVTLSENIQIQTYIDKIPSLARYRNAALFVSAAVLFGCSFVAIETGLRELPPLLFAALRFDVAAVALGSYILATRSRSAWLPRTRGDVLGIGVAGVFLIAMNNALLFVGQGSTTPAMASMMYGLNPVLAPVFAWWLLGDRLSGVGVLGIGVALAGVVVILQPSPDTLASAGTVGQALIMGAAVAVAIGSVLLKRVQARMDTLPLTAWATVVGAAALHVTSALAGESPTAVVGVSSSTVASLLVVGVPSTAVAYAIRFDLIGRIGPVRTNLVSYVVPIVAAVFGWLVLGAGVSPVTTVGFAVVVAGFVLVERDAVRREVCRIRRYGRRRRDTGPAGAAESPFPCDD